jgi:hypothetical protein
MRKLRIFMPLAVTGVAAAVSAVLLLGAVREGGEARSEPALAIAPGGPGGARNLALAHGLSFTDDSSSAFPIRGENLEDGRIASDRPTAIFFGTSHCWNTNREAERLVALYRKHAEEARFLVVDLERPSEDQRALVARFYAGSIPTLAFLDREGMVVYNQAGETASERGDIRKLEETLEHAKRIVKREA